MEEIAILDVTGFLYLYLQSTLTKFDFQPYNPVHDAYIREKGDFVPEREIQQHEVPSGTYNTAFRIHSRKLVIEVNPLVLHAIPKLDGEIRSRVLISI